VFKVKNPMGEVMRKIWLEVSSIARWLLLASVAALACSSGAYAGDLPQRASFDCRKAVTAVEKLICGDKELRELDASMSQRYKQMVPPDDIESDKTMEDQRNWLKNVRNKCATADCLKLAYRERINVLSGTTASFDCSKAATKMEKLICSDENLRYQDNSLNLAYRTLKAVSGEENKVVLAQKKWLSNISDQCNDVQCLAQAFLSRNAEFTNKREEIIASIRKSIGYAQRAFYSDAIRLPSDAHRTIAAFATQKSATNVNDSDPQQDEDFILDIYVLDTATYKVLQHTSDSIPSDAITFQGMSIATTDYAKVLGVPSFGIGLSHQHFGCAGYSASSLRLYAIQGKTLKAILPNITTSSSAGMCQTDCDSKATRRDLQFENRAGHQFPDLIVREKIVEIQEVPEKEKGVCKTFISRHNYTLPFDGVQYLVPQGLDY
jgi:uncharacterized protein